MEIKTTEKTGYILIEINGKLDETGAEALKKEFGKLRLQNIKEVRIDCQGISYIGSSGIGKILLLYKNLGLQGATLTLEKVPASLYTLFTELKLDTIFNIIKAY